MPPRRAPARTPDEDAPGADLEVASSVHAGTFLVLEEIEPAVERVAEEDHDEDQSLKDEDGGRRTV